MSQDAPYAGVRVPGPEPGRCGAPLRIGEHGRQVLEEAGYTPEAIAEPAASGTLKTQ